MRIQSDVTVLRFACNICILSTSRVFCFLLACFLALLFAGAVFASFVVFVVVLFVSVFFLFLFGLSVCLVLFVNCFV